MLPVTEPACAPVMPLETIVAYPPTEQLPVRGASRASRKALRIGVAALALASLGTVARALPGGGSPDLSVANIEVTQAVQDGNTPLTAGRSTCVRVTVQVDGAAADVGGVDGLLRVFVDGAEASFSPVFSENGPILAKLAPSPTLEKDTLNFAFLPPASGDVEITVEVNPAGPNFVTETNTANNSGTTGSLAFGELNVPELAYAPIDLNPGVGPPDPALIAPGNGDNFLHGIYPGKDWDYHRIDAPAKTWGQSVASSSGGQVLLNSLVVDRQLMVPIPDLVYGWVKGALPGYNGTSQIGGPVSMGNTEPIRHQRTFAHEIGHNFGLFHNGSSISVVGVDVEHHLAITESLPKVKPANLNDIMVAGLLTHQAWVAPFNYEFFMTHPIFNPNNASTAVEEPGLLVTGLWNRENGALQLNDVLHVEAVESTAPAAPAERDLLVRAFVGEQLVRELPFAIRRSLDECPACQGESGSDSEQSVPTVGFNFALTGLGTIDRVEISDPASPDRAPFELTRSASAPEVVFTSPTSSELFDTRLTVSWAGSDADGDALTYYLRYSPDGTRFAPILTSTSDTRVDVDLAELPGLVDGQGFFELMASDGLNTTRIQSLPLTPGTQLQGLGGNAPWVEVLSPDNGRRIPQGATVILHSSGWDLEDRAIDGASLEWYSNVDGFLGTGRLAAVADLTVGMHELRVEATDSDLMTTTATANVIILPRALPLLTEAVCQVDLGFAGPGASVLEVCGGDLSSGTAADLTLTGALPNQSAWFVAGFSNTPLAVFGGTLVPNPVAFLVPVTTDGNGEILVEDIAGGGGPGTVFVQVVSVDPGQVAGFALSNALQLDFLP